MCFDPSQVPRPGPPSLQPKRNAAASPLRPLPNRASKSINAEASNSHNINNASSNGGVEPHRSPADAPTSGAPAADAAAAAAGIAADYGVSDRVYRLVHGSNRPSVKRAPGAPPPPPPTTTTTRATARPLARDHHERATTPHRARSEGPVSRPPPPARPPAPRLPPPVALVASSSSSSSSSLSQPLLPPTPPLRQQPPPPQPTSSSSSSSSSADGAKSGNVPSNRKSRDSNSSVIFSLLCLEWS